MEMINKYLHKAIISLQNKRLIKPGINKNSAFPNYQITAKGEKVEKYMFEQKIERLIWEQARQLISK
jgi:hypothetical protein